MMFKKPPSESLRHSSVELAVAQTTDIPRIYAPDFGVAGSDDLLVQAHVQR